MLCPIGAITPVGGVLLIAGLDSPLVFVAARQTLALVLSFDRASACVPVYLFVCVCLLRVRVLCVVCAFSVCRLCMCVACALSLWSTDGQPWSCRDTSSAPILRGWCQLAIAHRPALGVKNMVLYPRRQRFHARSSTPDERGRSCVLFAQFCDVRARYTTYGST